MSKVGNQIPPNSMETEIAVLGSMMLNEKAIWKANDYVSSEDFYSQKHSLIFDTINELDNSGVRVDIMTLSDGLQKKGHLDTVGGRGYLAKVLKEVGTSANIEQYCLILLQFSLRRAIISSGQISTQDAYKLDKDIFEIIDNLKEKIEELENKIKGSEYESNEMKLIYETVKFSEQIINGTIKKLDTPFIDVNKIMNFYEGEMLVIGGRPSMGKTAISLSLAHHWAKDFKVGFISAEMTALSLTKRRLCFYSGYNFKELDSDPVKLQRAKELLLKNTTENLIIDDRANSSYFNLRSRIKQMVVRDKVKVVIIDYLQLIKGKGENKRAEVGSLSNLFKSIAKEFMIRIVVLAQLNRESAKGTKPEHFYPRPDQLKEAGEIEQDADHIWLIHRPEVYSSAKVDILGRLEDPENLGLIIYCKQRNGGTDVIPVTYVKNKMQFTNFISSIDIGMGEYPESYYNNN